MPSSITPSSAMTDETAKNTKPTVLMCAISAFAGVVLGAFLAVSVLHFVKLGCLTALSGALYICSMLTWVYIGWPVLAVAVIAGVIRGMLIQSRSQYTHWTRLVRWTVFGWMIGLCGQVLVTTVVAVAWSGGAAATRGMVVEDLRTAPPPAERGRNVVEFILTTAYALPALGAFAGTYGGWKRWKRTAQEEEMAAVAELPTGSGSVT